MARRAAFSLLFVAAVRAGTFTPLTAPGGAFDRAAAVAAAAGVDRAAGLAAGVGALSSGALLSAIDGGARAGAATSAAAAALGDKGYELALNVLGVGYAAGLMASIFLSTFNAASSFFPEAASSEGWAAQVKQTFDEVGEAGQSMRAWMTRRWTLYFGLAMAALGACDAQRFFVPATGAAMGNLLWIFPASGAHVFLTLLAGALGTAWLCEQQTTHGLGEGVTLAIAVVFAATMSAAAARVAAAAAAGALGVGAAMYQAVGSYAASFLVIVVLAVLLQGGTLRVPVVWFAREEGVEIDFDAYLIGTEAGRTMGMGGAAARRSTPSPQASNAGAAGEAESVAAATAATDALGGGSCNTVPVKVCASGLAPVVAASFLAVIFRLLAGPVISHGAEVAVTMALVFLLNQLSGRKQAKQTAEYLSKAGAGVRATAPLAVLAGVQEGMVNPGGATARFLFRIQQAANIVGGLLLALLVGLSDTLDAQFEALGISAGFTSLLIVVSAMSTVLRTLQAMVTVPRLFEAIDREVGAATAGNDLKSRA